MIFSNFPNLILIVKPIIEPIGSYYKVKYGTRLAVYEHNDTAYIL